VIVEVSFEGVDKVGRGKLPAQPCRGSDHDISSSRTNPE
jgi:hypothetical protein